MIDRAATDVARAFMLALMLGVGALVAASAARAESGPQLVQTQAENQDFSEAKLTAFAEAANDVSAIAREWGPEIQKAEDAGNAAKARELQKQAQREMRETIQQAEGISMSEYSAIADAARQDEELHNRIIQKMNQAN